MARTAPRTKPEKHSVIGEKRESSAFPAALLNRHGERTKQDKALSLLAFADARERLKSEPMDAYGYAKFVLALGFVLGLIGLMAAAARRWGLGLPQAQVRRGQAKRLGLVEVAALDSKRRMVLIKRDDVEHLIILGHDGETVVETGIKPPTPPTFPDVLQQAQDAEAKPKGAP